MTLNRLLREKRVADERVSVPQIEGQADLLLSGAPCGACRTTRPSWATRPAQSLSIRAISFTKRHSLFAIMLSFCLYYYSILALFDLRKETWIYGDWVINYSGGFIRRGMTGALLLALGPIDMLPWSTLALHLILYGSFFYFLFLLFRKSQNNILMICCLLSPLGLFYGVFNYYEIGKKEIILYLIILLQLTLFSNKNMSIYMHATFIFTTGIVLVLSHEGMFFFLIFPLLIMFLHGMAKMELKRSVELVAVILVLFLVLLVLIMSYGINDYSITICASLEIAAPHNCATKGAIAYLQKKPATAIFDTFRQLSVGSSVSLVVSLVAGFAPMYLVLYRLRSMAPRPEFSRFFVGIISCTAFTIPLYIVAQDWGRWLHVTYLCALFSAMYFMNMFGMGACAAEIPLRGAAVHRAQFTNLSTVRVLAFVLAFDVVWNPPMLNRELVDFGIFRLGARLLWHAIE